MNFEKDQDEAEEISEQEVQLEDENAGDSEPEDGESLNSENNDDDEDEEEDSGDESFLDDSRSDIEDCKRLRDNDDDDHEEDEEEDSDGIDIAHILPRDQQRRRLNSAMVAPSALRRDIGRLLSAPIPRDHAAHAHLIALTTLNRDPNAEFADMTVHLQALSGAPYLTESQSDILQRLLGLDDDEDDEEDGSDMGDFIVD